MIHLDMYGIIHQRSIWRSQDDTWWRIEMPDADSILDSISDDIAKLPLMEKDHAENLIAWLDRRALRIQTACFSCALASTIGINGDMALESIEHEIDMEFEDEPHEWLHKMPLYKSLKEYVDDNPPHRS